MLWHPSGRVRKPRHPPKLDKSDKPLTDLGILQLLYRKQIRSVIFLKRHQAGALMACEELQ